METDLVRFGRIACFVASAAMFAVPSIAKASESQTRFADRLAVAMKGSQRFESSRSLHDLRESVVSLAGVQEYSGLSVDDVDDVENRRSIVTSFLQIFKQIDAATDPTFSTDHGPVYDCLIPPPEGDMQLPSCADPSDIKDPRVRATYVVVEPAQE